MSTRAQPADPPDLGGPTDSPGFCQATGSPGFGGQVDRVAAARPPDLRLAGVAVGAWLAALAVLHGGVSVAIGVVATAAGAGLVVAVALRRGWTPSPSGHGWLVVAALIGAVCGGAATGARVAGRDAGPVADLAARRATVQVEIVVRDDPRPVARTSGGPPVYIVPAELTRVAPTAGGAFRTSVRVLVLASDSGWRDLLPGQRARASGRLMASRGGDLNAAALSTTSPPERIGRPPWPQRAAGALRAGLQRACDPLPDEPGGLLPGLVVGDTSALDPAVEEDFRATGLTHLVAVSGANVAIVLGAVLLLARWARAGPRLATVACVLALIGFVILARPSPSVVRAAAMGAIGLLALATGRVRAATPALCAAVTVLVIADPELAGHAGFALSVMATGGLLLIAPRWRDALRRRGVPAGIAEALAVPAAAQVACAPVVAGLSGTVSLVSVPANLLAVPAIAPATVLGVAAALASPVWPDAAQFLAWLAGWPARWLVAIARVGAGLPAGALPWPGGVPGALLLGGLTVAAAVAMRRRAVRTLVAVVAAAAVLGALPVRLVASGWPPADWVMVACAVGQGDAAVLAAGRGEAVVVDAGPDPAAVDRCLRRLGIRRVRLLVISHFHADHIGGLEGVFRGRRVDEVVTTPWPEPAGGRERVGVVAGAHGAAARPVAAGWSYVAAGLRITAIGPPQRLAGTRSDPNNNSLVLRGTVRGVTILLAGDAEGEEQRAMLEHLSGAGLRADVLKLAHHGSAYQDPGFLDAVDPAVALVSAGAGNRYGHPNPGVLASLARGGARVLRTDVDGDLAAVRTAEGLAVVARGIDPGTRPPRASSDAARAPPGAMSGCRIVATTG